MVLVNQLIQRGIVRRLIRDSGVNVVHQPIPVSPKAPSFIWDFGVPVIIGPMNGGMDYPPVFTANESFFTRGSVWLGRLSATFVNRLIPGKRYAHVLLVANERTRMALPRGANGRIVEMPENGVDLSIWSAPAQPLDVALRPRFVYVGRLVDWKRLDFVLHALAACKEATLDVIGDGPMRTAWTATAETLGVADRVHWLGWLSQAECARRLGGANALLLPSIYECGGAVVLEAMACAVPVVAVAWGGPADYVDSTCGILISPSSSDAIIRGFADAQERLMADGALRSEMGAAGRKRVEAHFDWEGKIDRILDIYRQSISDYRT
jgi:glycosyltransferase involved in cell wall biosynthesis